jgi:GNAT superfamily N-acetyltransferase
MNIKIVRTNAKNQDFNNLIEKLDAYLKITDGNEHAFYNQFNNTDTLKRIVLLYLDDVPAGCGAIKEFDSLSMEVKRMFVCSDKRGLGLAQKIMKELETSARELGYKKCILETGKRQLEALNFYLKNTYKVIPNYGQYIGMENSVCFEKHI